MADIGLEAINAQDDLPLFSEDVPESAIGGEGGGEEFVVEAEEVGNGAFGHVDVSVVEVSGDLGRIRVG